MTAKLFRSGRPERVDDYADVGGELAERLRVSGIRSAVGAPINVAGRRWGAIMVVSDQPCAFPDDTEQRIERFAELVTAALANADARQQLAASRARIVEAGYASRRTAIRSSSSRRRANARPRVGPMLPMGMPNARESA